MNAFFKVLSVFAITGLVLLLGYWAGYVIYIWSFGVLTGLEASIGLPFWAGIVIVILGFIVARWLFALLCVGFGIYGGIWVLGWAWYWSLALYLPTLVLTMLAGMFISGAVVISAIIVVLNEALRRR